MSFNINGYGNPPPAGITLNITIDLHINEARLLQEIDKLKSLFESLEKAGDYDTH